MRLRQQPEQHQFQDGNAALQHGACQYVTSSQEFTGVVPSVHFFAADDMEPNFTLSTMDRVLDRSEL